MDATWSKSSLLSTLFVVIISFFYSFPGRVLRLHLVHSTYITGFREDSLSSMLSLLPQSIIIRNHHICYVIIILISIINLYYYTLSLSSLSRYFLIDPQSVSNLPVLFRLSPIIDILCAFANVLLLPKCSFVLVCSILTLC